MPMQFRSDDTSYWPYKFGSGADGAWSTTTSTTWNPVRASCSGLSGSTSLSITAVSGTFSNGQLVMIHQSRGTGAGNWELNKIASGGGTSSLTMTHTLQNTYTDSGASQAQIVRLYEYTTATVNSGHTITIPAWDGNAGGIMCFSANQLCTITGSISAVGRGYLGATAISSINTNGKQGEGSGGARDTASTSANGSGGGGGAFLGGVSTAGGGGGGNGATGETGSGDGAVTEGVGGLQVGNAALTTMFMGGAGGSGSAGGSGTSGAGGVGGGLILILAKQITITGTIPLTGNNGGNGSGDTAGGGGGAGGSCLIKAQVATLGTNKITAAGGSRGTGSTSTRWGGAGAVGRIHLDYLASYSGTTSPTLDVRQDFSLRLGQSTGGVI